MFEINLNDADYLLRECVNSIKGSIDQIYFGLFDFLSEEEKVKFLEHIKGQSDSLQDVLNKSIVEKAKKINDLNLQLVKTIKELEKLKKTLEIKVEHRTNEVKKIQHVTIFALARLAESRDTETGEHLKRIRTYSYLIAKRLAKHKRFKSYIDKHYIQNVYYSSPLHDIGKVGISDSVLLKEGILLPKEFETMKMHTIIGGRTLEDAERQLKRKLKSFLSMGKKIAYCHHERWDGTGYPYGLKKNEIPLSARIVSLADVYDALTSKRIYKEAYNHDVSREIIIEGKGKQFDPVIVDAFLSLEHKFKKIANPNKEL